MNKTIIYTPEGYAENDIRWEGTNGLGYQSKKEEGTGRIGLIRCPKCGTENYAMAVSEGICYKCGFNANEKV
jgi:ribosomal protein L37E